MTPAGCVPSSSPSGRARSVPPSGGRRLGLLRGAVAECAWSLASSRYRAARPSVQLHLPAAGSGVVLVLVYRDFWDGYGVASWTLLHCTSASIYAYSRCRCGWRRSSRAGDPSHQSSFLDLSVYARSSSHDVDDADADADANAAMCQCTNSHPEMTCTKIVDA